MEDILREIRDKSIREEYFNTIKSLCKVKPYISNDEIVKEMLKKPAPRFFISYESARRIISLMQRGENINIQNKNKRQMYNDLYEAFLKCKKKMNVPGYCILKIILEEEAPSYYVSSYTMRSIVYRTIKNK